MSVADGCAPMLIVQVGRARPRGYAVVIVPEPVSVAGELRSRVAFASGTDAAPAMVASGCAQPSMLAVSADGAVSPKLAAAASPYHKCVNQCSIAAYSDSTVNAISHANDPTVDEVICLTVKPWPSRRRTSCISIDSSIRFPYCVR